MAIARIDGGSVPRQGKPWTSPDALVVRGFNGAVAVEARPGGRLCFGRAPDPAAEGMRLGEDDLRVSRTHGVLVHRQQWWWLRNTGSLPIEISGGRRVHKADEEYPLDPGHTTLVITGSNDRKHILHLYINGPDGGRQPYPVPDGRTVEQIVWPLTPRQRRVLVVLGQRYLRSGDVDPQPLTRQGTVDHLNELWPGERWTLRKVDHVVEPVRLHLHAKGVRGVVEAEVDPPVGNKLSHNLLVELTVKTATLTPGDLRLIDGGE
jgi:hypothetical protein